MDHSWREQKKKETKAAIIAAARELFISQGYADTTLQDIAEKAGVSQRTIFSYFPSKEAIIFDQHRVTIDMFMDRLHNRGEARVIDVLRSIYEEKTSRAISPQHTKFHHEMKQLVQSDPHLKEHFAHIFSEVEAHIADIVAEENGVKPGSFEVHLIASSLRTLFQHGMTTPGAWDTCLPETALEYIEGGLARIKRQQEK